MLFFFWALRLLIPRCYACRHIHTLVRGVRVAAEIIEVNVWTLTGFKIWSPTVFFKDNYLLLRKVYPFYQRDFFSTWILHNSVRKSQLPQDRRRRLMGSRKVRTVLANTTLTSWSCWVWWVYFLLGTYGSNFVVVIYYMPIKANWILILLTLRHHMSITDSRNLLYHSPGPPDSSHSPWILLRFCHIHSLLIFFDWIRFMWSKANAR